jgi:hypothetical protein
VNALHENSSSKLFEQGIQLKTNQDEGVTSLVDLLTLVSGGKATITVGGVQFVRLDGSQKALEIEADGARLAGLHLSDFAVVKGRPLGLLMGPVHIAGVLSDLGWKVTLCYGGERVLSMGKGSSRLAGRVTVYPLKLRRLLKALK